MPDDFCNVGDLILSSVPCGESYLEVAVIYYLFCPMENAECGAQFLFTENTTRDFTAPCTCSIALLQSKNALTSTLDCVDLALFKASDETAKSFGTVCNQVLNNRKMAARKGVFRSLGYLYIFSIADSQKTQPTSALCLNVMKEASCYR